MGIAEDIKKTIQSRLVIRYCTEEMLKNPEVFCIVCERRFKLDSKLCMYIRGDGHICSSCSDRYAPELKTLLDVSGDVVKNRGTFSQHLTIHEWKEIWKHLSVLLKLTVELSRGISRGIVEAPSGHIGLLHLAKDIGKPARKEDETDKDYDLRVKSHRMVHLFDKIKNETWGRVAALQEYFAKLGMPAFPDKEEDPGDGRVF
ncbi:MAG: hypothetical protein JW915_22095 [Chitinispirillaceae bacterium]|nr:hypothetical protein [Chitinispirillaceae bacterium]